MVEPLTQEWMLKTLIDLGFSLREAEVYVFLALNGEHKVSGIAEALGTCKCQVYHTIRKLRDIQVVSGTQKLPASFTAIPFDKTLDMLARDSLQEATRIEENKNDILALWDYCIKKR